MTIFTPYTENFALLYINLYCTVICLHASVSKGIVNSCILAVLQIRGQLLDYFFCNRELKLAIDVVFFFLFFLLIPRWIEEPPTGTLNSARGTRCQNTLIGSCSH